MKDKQREELAERLDVLFRGETNYYGTRDGSLTIISRFNDIQKLMVDDVFGGLGDDTVANLVWLAMDRAFRLGKEEAAGEILKGVESGVYWAGLSSTKMSYEDNIVLERRPVPQEEV